MTRTALLIAALALAGCHSTARWSPCAHSTARNEAKMLAEGAPDPASAISAETEEPTHER